MTTSYTNAQLKAKLKEIGVAFRSKAPRAELLSLLAELSAKQAHAQPKDVAPESAPLPAATKPPAERKPGVKATLYNLFKVQARHPHQDGRVHQEARAAGRAHYRADDDQRPQEPVVRNEGREWEA